MKKILSLALLIGLFFLFGCTDSVDPNPEKKEEEETVKLLETRIPSPKEGVLDDFTSGINSDVWVMSTRNWSSAVSNGQKAENVGYTKDGILILKAKGNLYDDPSMRTTGACLITKDTFGPGSFEVSMRLLPRLGVCNAFWTFYYENDDTNHEIDIELPGNKSYQTVLNTNWTGVNSRQYTSIKHEMPSPLNDNQWHKYKFEWKTDPASISYYVDDVLTETITRNVPTIAGNLWIGVWFPNEWCGTPNFEEDALLVDWVAYTPYLDQPYTKKDYTLTMISSNFPTEPIEMPSLNVLSKSSLSGFTNQQIHLNENEELVQVIEEVYEGYSYKLKYNSIGEGYVAIEYLDANQEVLDVTMMTLYSNSLNEKEFTKEFVAPEGSKQMRITFTGVKDWTVKNPQLIYK